MKKMTKKLGAIVLAMAMCFSLFATALAASSDDTDFSITITNAAANQTYTAYKIFDVTYDDNGNYSYTIQSTSAWYDTLQESYSGLATPFSFDETTEAGTYTVTVKTDPASTTDPQETYDDAYIISYLEAAIAAIGTPQEQSDGTVIWNIPETYGGIEGTWNSDGTVTIDVEEPGYYFVTTTNGSVVSITTTNPEATITDKNEGFDLKKEVKNGLTENGDFNDDGTADGEDGSKHSDAEAMGDDVEFTVTANVPLYTSVEPQEVKDGLADPSPEGYLVTNYVFDDHMSAGLEIRGLTTDAGATSASDCSYYTKTDTNGVVHYYATDALINQWITLTDAAGNEYKLCDYIDETTGDTVKGCAYNVVLELTDISWYLDDNEVEQIQFDGFTLSYDTLDFVYDSEGNRTAVLNAEGQELDLSKYETAAELVADSGTRYPANASIEIDYTAKVTNEATYDNTNEITMDWQATAFRHPNPLIPEYSGEEEDGNDIYVLDLDITKLDESTREALAGAEFKLEGTNLKDVVTNSSVKFEPLHDRATYEARKGQETLWFQVYVYNDEGEKTDETTYTSVDPYTLTNEDELAKYVVNPYYDNPDYPDAADYPYVAYTRVEEHAEETTDASGETTRNITGITQADGTLTFTGLTVGDWTLTEITAPDGYNLLDKPISFTISVTWSLNTDTGKYDPVWSITETSTGTSYNLTVNPTNGHIDVEILNNSGTLLPGTGGIGTTIFYIIGGVLVAGAVVVLVTRRRMNREA